MGRWDGFMFISSGRRGGSDCGGDIGIEVEIGTGIGNGAWVGVAVCREIVGGIDSILSNLHQSQCSAESAVLVMCGIDEESQVSDMWFKRLGL